MVIKSCFIFNFCATLNFFLGKFTDSADAIRMKREVFASFISTSLRNINIKSKTFLDILRDEIRIFCEGELTFASWCWI